MRRERTPEQGRRPAWSVPVTLSQVPQSGRHFDLLADEKTRAAIAKLAGLEALPRLLARFDVVPYGREGLHVLGHVSATVGQTCVVTLEPVENQVEEPVDLVFAPAAPDALTAGEEIQVSIEDGPEQLVGGTVDLGALATEFLLLGIDPYPRRAGAVLATAALGDDDAHPFAELAALSTSAGKRGGGNQG